MRSSFERPGRPSTFVHSSLHLRGVFGMGRPTNSLHRAPPRNVLDSATISGCGWLAPPSPAAVEGGAGELEERWA